MPYKLPKSSGTVESVENTRKLDTVFIDNIRDTEEIAEEFIQSAIKAETSADRNLLLSDDEIWELSIKLLTYCEAQAGIQLFIFQRAFALRLIYSVLIEDADEISALFSRQSGKTETVSVVVDGLLIILPIIARTDPYSRDDRFSKFKHGFWVGVFGPTYELAGIMYSRMRTNIFSEHARQVLADPDIAVDLSAFKGKALRFPNGSFVDVQSAGPGAKIEGKTYHLIIVEECQDVPTIKITKSIHPMLAFNAGSLCKIGTPNPDKNNFYTVCTQNRSFDARFLADNSAEAFARVRRHFEYDYTHICAVNPKYAKHIAKEKERLGFDSDEFRMSYRLHWLTERNRFITEELLDKCAIRRGVTLLWRDDDGEVKGQFQISALTQPSYGGTVVAAIDFGKVKSATVVTVAQVWYERPYYDGQDERYRLHVLDWLEIEGDDHEVQYPQILDFLSRYPQLHKLICDATGKGDPIYSRLSADLECNDTVVVPFIFSTQSKHDGYTILGKELYAQRTTYPYAKETMTRRTKRFHQQMVDLSKTWKGRHMVVEKQADDPGAQDDYADSLMMLCWAANVDKSGHTEEVDNPFLNTTRRNILLGARRQRAFWGTGSPGAPRQARSTLRSWAQLQPNAMR